MSNFNADIPGPGLDRIPGPEAQTDSKPGLFDCSRGIQRRDKTRRWSKRDSNPWSLPARAGPLFADEKGRRSIRMVVNGTRSSGGCKGRPGHWSNHSLYDPQDGSTYDVTAELTAPNAISARVYRGVPLFGRTEI